MAFTGVCTTEFCDISAGIAEYEALDAKVFGISGDNPFAQEAWAKKAGITLPAAQRLRTRGGQGLRRGLRAVPARGRT